MEKDDPSTARAPGERPPDLAAAAPVLTGTPPLDQTTDSSEIGNLLPHPNPAPGGVIEPGAPGAMAGGVPPAASTTVVSTTIPSGAGTGQSAAGTATAGGPASPIPSPDGIGPPPSTPPPSTAPAPPALAARRRRSARLLTAASLLIAAVAAAVAWLAIDRIDLRFDDGDWESLAVAAGVVAIIALGAAAVGAWRWYRPAGSIVAGVDRGFGATLVGSAWLVIGVATAVTVIVYILPTRLVEDRLEVEEGFWADWGRYVAVVAGIALAAGAGCVYALAFRDHASPEHTQPRLFGELSGRWTSLDARVRRFCPPALPTGEHAALATMATVSCAEAAAHRDVIAQELALPGHALPHGKAAGAKWVLGTGFIDLWVRLHDAEEALLVVSPREQVIASAVFDESRLVDGTMENREALLTRMRWAVSVLGGEKYLITMTSAPVPKVEAADRTPESLAQARLILRDIRHAINRFRDARREALVRSRNHLAWTGMITGVVAYALLALAVVVGAPQENVVAAVAFFTVGAAVGLFDQLRVSAASQSAEEDFGLGQARLFYTPVLSGLAAVGGVLVTAMLFATLNGPVVKYPESLARPVTSPGTTDEREIRGTGEDVDLELPPLWMVFDLNEDRFGLVIAAVFGLTPSLLVDRLQGQANRYKADLESTSARSG